MEFTTAGQGPSSTELPAGTRGPSTAVATWLQDPWGMKDPQLSLCGRGRKVRALRSLPRAGVGQEWSAEVGEQVIS